MAALSPSHLRKDLKSDFEEYFRVPSSGPNIRLFPKTLDSIDKASYRNMVDEEEPIKEFLENQRNCKNILPLSLLFFGGWFESEFVFKTRRYRHSAESIAKVI